MRPRRATLPLAALLLATFAALATVAARRDSVTSDEVAHLPAGYTYLKRGDFRLNRQHPPLAKALAAVPLVPLDLAPIETLPGWEQADDRVFGAAFLTSNRAPLEQILFLGRLPMVGCGLLLCFLLFRWARELWGDTTGLWVLLLAALNPELLAHSHLVTTDAPLACCTVVAVYLLWRFSARGSMSDAAGCGCALGCALLVKYSGLLTAALLAALLAALRWHGHAPRRLPAAAALIATIAVAMVSVVYRSPLGIVEYARSVSQMNSDFDFRQPAYLWGEHSVDGFPHYYLLAQLWKTPLPALMLFAVALALLPLRRSEARRDWLFIVLPIAAFHGAGIFYRPNIGIRHVLPALPFLLLATGEPVRRALTAGPLARAAVAALGLWYAAGTLRVAPHFLSYFNEVVGGAENGIHYLSDSNLDWGQDVSRLRDYLSCTRPAQVRAAVFSPLDLAAQGIASGPIRLRDVVWPEEGVTYAVSANYLVRNYNIGRATLRFRWLERYRPVAILGGSIRVYRFSTDPADAGRDDLTYVPRHRWYADAEQQLSDLLAADPAAAEPRQLLARIRAERAQHSSPDRS